MSNIEDLPDEWEQRARECHFSEPGWSKAAGYEDCAEELREALRWIPVSERLPTEKGDYLVADCTSEPFVIAVNWFNPAPHGLGAFGSYVTHWRPLPKGPTE